LKAKAYVLIADAQLAAGDSDEAAKSVEAAKNTLKRPVLNIEIDGLVGLIAKAQAKAGDVAGAIEYSERAIDDPWSRCCWMAMAAKELCGSP
jgi:uncharacterized membrane-anchored protein